MNIIAWGKSDAKANQGWMFQNLTRSEGGANYWSCHFSEFWNTHERDGAVTLRKDGSFRSETGKYVSYPYAVMDDFGFLQPVPMPP